MSKHTAWKYFTLETKVSQTAVSKLCNMDASQSGSRRLLFTNIQSDSPPKQEQKETEFAKYFQAKDTLKQQWTLNAAF